MSLIQFDKVELELFRKYFLYIAIIVLSWANYMQFMRIQEVQDERIKDLREQVETYKEGFFETNNVLQNQFKYEGIKIIDTVYRGSSNDRR